MTAEERQACNAHVDDIIRIKNDEKEKVVAVYKQLVDDTAKDACRYYQYWLITMGYAIIVTVLWLKS